MQDSTSTIAVDKPVQQPSEVRLQAAFDKPVAADGVEVVAGAADDEERFHTEDRRFGQGR